MSWFKDLLVNNFITRIVSRIRANRRYKKRLAEIKKRDPFIYK